MKKKVAEIDVLSNEDVGLSGAGWGGKASLWFYILKEADFSRLVSAPSSVTPCTVKPEDELWLLKSFSVVVVTVSAVGTFMLNAGSYWSSGCRPL